MDENDDEKAKNVETGSQMNLLGEVMKLLCDLEPNICLSSCMGFLQEFRPNDLLTHPESLHYAIVATRLVAIVCSAPGISSRMREYVQTQSKESKVIQTLLEMMISLSDLANKGFTDSLDERVGNLSRDLISTLSKFSPIFALFPDILKEVVLRMIAVVESVSLNPSLQRNSKALLNSKNASKSLIKLTIDNDVLKILSSDADFFINSIGKLSSPSTTAISTSTSTEFCIRITFGISDPERQILSLKRLCLNFLPVWDSPFMQSLYQDTVILNNCLSNPGPMFVDSAPNLENKDIRVILRLLLNSTSTLVECLMSQKLPRENSVLIWNFGAQEIIQSLLPKILSFSKSLVSVFTLHSTILSSADCWETFKSADGGESSMGIVEMTSSKFESIAARRRWMYHIRQKAFELIGLVCKDTQLYHRLASSSEISELFFSSVFFDIENIHPYLLSTILTSIMPHFISSCPLIFYDVLLRPVLCALIKGALVNLSKRWEQTPDDVFSANKLNEASKNLVDLLTDIVFPINTASKPQTEIQDSGHPPLLQMICVSDELLFLVILASVKLSSWPVSNVQIKALQIPIKFLATLTANSQKTGAIASHVLQSSIQIAAATNLRAEEQVRRRICALIHECLSRCPSFPDQILGICTISFNHQIPQRVRRHESEHHFQLCT